MYELEIKMRDSVNTVENQNAIVKKELQYDYEKKELKMKTEQDKKDLLAKEELKQKEKERNYFIIGFAMVMILAGFIFRSYREKNKANEIITAKKEEVEKQKEIIEEKQKEILDSIHYAKRIQTALITSEKYIERSLKRLND